MGAEGVPSPWAGPISVLRDMGGSAEANEKPSAAQRSDRGASSSDDEALTFSIRRQQGRPLSVGAQESCQQLVIVENVTM